MRFSIITLLLCFSLVSTAQVEITFEKELIELGAVKKGEIRKMEFPFVNTGKESIKINQVSACECTELDWPRHTIKPGESGTITAIFDSGKKDKVEVIDVDIYLENLDKETDAPIFKYVSYSYSFK